MNQSVILETFRYRAMWMGFCPMLLAIDDEGQDPRCDGSEPVVGMTHALHGWTTTGSLLSCLAFAVDWLMQAPWRLITGADFVPTLLRKTLLDEDLALVDLDGFTVIVPVTELS